MATSQIKILNKFFSQVTLRLVHTVWRNLIKACRYNLFSFRFPGFSLLILGSLSEVRQSISPTVHQSDTVGLVSCRTNEHVQKSDGPSVRQFITPTLSNYCTRSSVRQFISPTVQQSDSSLLKNILYHSFSLRFYINIVQYVK